VRFVVDKVTSGKGVLRVFRFSPVIVISPMVHIHLHVRVAPTKRTNGGSVGTSLGNAGALG
jgi:hypothetical protein